MNATRYRWAASQQLIPGVLVLLLALGFFLPACSAQDKKGPGADAKASDSSKVLARVNGKPITQADVQTDGNDQFEQLEREYMQRKHDLTESEIKKIVQDRLLETEAAARGVTKDALLAEVKPTEPTDADAEAFYEKNKARMPQGTAKETLMPQIKAYLQQNSQADAREKYFQTLEAKYKVDYLYDPIRVDVAAAGYPARGPAAAPVTIVEFSDFQCPFCSRITPTLEQVVAKYGDKVRLVFRQFPLPMHQNAAKAAEAALCANEQGKFWQMHDAMFKDQAGLAVDGLKTKAAAISGINAANFNTCLDSGKEAVAVQADMKAGNKAGVNGTPAMFVNGRFISGVVSSDDLSKVIDDELKRKGTS
jgi:protein-disulfide isomerase